MLSNNNNKLMDFLINKSIEEISDQISLCINRELQSGKRVLLLISGGSAIALEVLVSSKINIDFSHQLTVTLVDERYGPLGHNDSNWSNIINQGFVFNNATFIPFLSNESLSDTVKDLNDIIKSKLIEADYKVGVFGIGEDGHTAGILPHSEALSSSQLVCGYETQKFNRITTTAHVIKMLDEAFVFAYGKNKWKVLDNLQKEVSTDEEPCQLLKIVPSLTIFTDYQIK